MSTPDHRGYTVGPTLAATEWPWPITWERRVDDDCPHDWELVLLAADGLHRTRVEEVVRCADCHVPRCGHSTDEDPCSLRRHHAGEHLTETMLARACPPSIEEDPIAIRFGWTRWQKVQASRREAPPAVPHA